jgi:hypothetical protein
MWIASSFLLAMTNNITLILSIKQTMKKNIISLLLILFGLSSLPLQAQKEVTVRLNPKVGVTYTTTIKNTMMNLMELQGQSMTMTQSMETKSSFTAKNVSDKEILIEGQNDALKVTISQMGMVLTYDSENPEKTSPMLADQADELASALHKPYTMSFNALGCRTTTEDEPEMSQLGSVIIQLPNEPLKVGSTWTTDKKQQISGSDINASMTYTVTKISKKNIEIEVKGKIEGGEETNGTYDGTANIDPQTGLITSSSIKQNISMTISEQGLSIPVTINGTTTVTME